MRFSIIVPHYQGAVKHEAFCKCIKSLEDQLFSDYEIICLHDGPLLDGSLDMPCEVLYTEQRIGDWGHTLRNVGMEMAKGEYIIHTNADNVLYRHALAELDRRIQLDEDPNILIFFVAMMGLEKNWETNQIYYKNPRDYTKWQLLTGYPPEYGNIDCMQLVMKKELWEKEGGWYNTTEQSDGKMYPEFCKKYGYTHIYKILGEHY